VGRQTAATAETYSETRKTENARKNRTPRGGKRESWKSCYARRKISRNIFLEQFLVNHNIHIHLHFFEAKLDIANRLTLSLQLNGIASSVFSFAMQQTKPRR
jgi:hypothetical protein